MTDTTRVIGMASPWHILWRTAITVPESDPSAASLVKPATTRYTNGIPIFEFTLGGVGGDTNEITYTLFGLQQFGFENGPIYRTTSLGTGSFNLTTLVGVASGIVGTDFRFSDTCAFTPSAYATYLAAIAGRAATTYSPAANAGVAVVGIPFASALIGFVIVPDFTSLLTSINGFSRTWSA